MASDGKSAPEPDGADTAKAVEDVLRSAGLELSQDQTEALRLVDEEDAINALRHMNMPGTKLAPQSLAAQKIFGQWLLQRVEIKPLLATWWADSVSACQTAVDEIRKLLRSRRLRSEHRVELNRRLIEASLALSATLERFSKFAIEAGMVKNERARPLVLPPDFGREDLTQVNVSINVGDGKESAAAAIPVTQSDEPKRVAADT